jgi:hypothetical protein
VSNNTSGGLTSGASSGSNTGAAAAAAATAMYPALIPTPPQSPIPPTQPSKGAYPDLEYDNLKGISVDDDEPGMAPSQNGAVVPIGQPSRLTSSGNTTSPPISPGGYGQQQPSRVTFPTAIPSPSPQGGNKQPSATPPPAGAAAAAAVAAAGKGGKQQPQVPSSRPEGRREGAVSGQNNTGPSAGVGAGGDNKAPAQRTPPTNAWPSSRDALSYFGRVVPPVATPATPSQRYIPPSALAGVHRSYELSKFSSLLPLPPRDPRLVDPVPLHFNTDMKNLGLDTPLPDSIAQAWIMAPSVVRADQHAAIQRDLNDRMSQLGAALASNGRRIGHPPELKLQLRRDLVSYGIVTSNAVATGTSNAVASSSSSSSNPHHSNPGADISVYHEYLPSAVVTAVPVVAASPVNYNQTQMWSTSTPPQVAQAAPVTPSMPTPPYSSPQLGGDHMKGNGKEYYNTPPQQGGAVAAAVASANRYGHQVHHQSLPPAPLQRTPSSNNVVTSPHMIPSPSPPPYTGPPSQSPLALAMGGISPGGYNNNPPGYGTAMSTPSHGGPSPYSSSPPPQSAPALPMQMPPLPPPSAHIISGGTPPLPVGAAIPQGSLPLPPPLPEFPQVQSLRPAKPNEEKKIEYVFCPSLAPDFLFTLGFFCNYFSYSRPNKYTVKNRIEDATTNSDIATPIELLSWLVDDVWQYKYVLTPTLYFAVDTFIFACCWFC